MRYVVYEFADAPPPHATLTPNPLHSWDHQVGSQGLGVHAGSRIRWPNARSTRTTAVDDNTQSGLVYYDVAGSMTSPGRETRSVVYLGCFRDHPGTLREFYRTSVEEGEADSEDVRACSYLVVRVFVL